MSLADTHFEAFWVIAYEGKLLSKVEDFLIHADEPGLQLQLHKLQQDVGVEIGEHLTRITMDPQPLDDGNPEPFVGPALASAYEPVTPERLKILDNVLQALEAHGAKVYHDYARFRSNIQHFIDKGNNKPSAGMPPIPTFQ